MLGINDNVDVSNDIDFSGNLGMSDFDSFVVSAGPVTDFTITSPEYNSLTFDCGDDKQVVLTYGNGKLELSGDGDMNEAAKRFFEYFLKPLVDTYVKKELEREE